ncbi:hypothetical protein DFH11DRAFT_1599209 [Phellopilus nigrolimitatus]|nr:hypothetical protein DFH11DRAFT_1599209 [Phellopilus nigrolimitatus]
MATPRKSIEWAVHKEVFTFSPAVTHTVNVSNSSPGPRKSILKPQRPLQPFPEEKKRDITPLPDDALSDAHFLEYPVSMITAESSTLRELTEAYSILAARIRSSVPQHFWSYSTRDPRHPLFNPMRQHADALAGAIVRDLGRVFADPFQLPTPTPPSRTPEHGEAGSTSLPTPQETPTKKGGMTEEQVKYARDLSTVTSATIKFLILAFQVPTIYNVFSKKQLDSVLTAVLAIPLAESLRSPSARKICGFAITFLQSQRLPEVTLRMGRDRMAFALRRAMDGELGREGKKGATGEALRAIHDLSLFKPEIFIPGFEAHLSSVLENLLAPSHALRVQAAHALGGFVQGITQPGVDSDDLLRDISPRVAHFFSLNSPSSICRTLGAALRTTEPAHHGQGPFWAISVLTSFIILFGPALLKDRQLFMNFRATIDFGLNSKKKVVRAATSTLWGPLIWVWQKWRGSVSVSKKDEEGEDDAAEREEVKAYFSQMLRSTTHLPIGISFIGALLGGSHSTCQRQDLLMAFYNLGSSAKQGGDSTPRALELLDRLINSREDGEFYTGWSNRFLTKLIPSPLLSVSPGLLTTEMGGPALGQLVESIMAHQPNYDDVRPLADEERRLPSVWTRAKDAWIMCLEQLEMSEGEPVSELFLDIWTGLIRMGLTGRDEPTAINIFAEQCSKVLTSILSNKAVDLREVPDYREVKAPSSDSAPVKNDAGKSEIADDGACSAANMRLKLALVRALWAAAMGALPASSLRWTVKPMLRLLVQKHHELAPPAESDGVVEDEASAAALSEWAQLCAQVAAVGSTEMTPAIWGRKWEWDETMRARAWRGYARGWAEDSRGSWKGAAIVLGLPFRNDQPWDMSDADLSAWNSLLSYAVEKAGKDYISLPDVLEEVVRCIERQHIISLSSTLRVADHLVSMFDKAIERCTALPSGLIDIVHEILITSYPPQPRNKIVAIWLLRSLRTTIGNCPVELIVELLETLQDGLVTWIMDECALFSKEEYSSEIIPLFQTMLVALEPLPPSVEVLQSLSAIFASALQVETETGTISDERVEALVSFTEFWETKCSGLVAPRDGWAEGIAQALLLAFPEKNAVGQPYENMHEDDEDIDELDVLPRTTTPRRRLVNEVPLPPSPSPVQFKFAAGVPTMTTPKKVTKAAAMRPRRLTASRLPALFADEPLSPTVQRENRRKSTGGRLPRLSIASGSGPVSLSSDRDHTSTEKENIMPSSGVDNVVILGKKRELSAADSSLLRGKRQRIQSGGSDDSEDAHDRAAVEDVLLNVSVTSPARTPFGDSNINAYEIPQTPSKRARTTTSSSLMAQAAGSPGLSPPKRRRTQDHGQSPKIPRRLSYSSDEDEDSLPSSDVESEEEISGSSSPVGPFTPQTRRAEFALRIQSDPASDDSVVTSSSPTRNIRQTARASRLSSSIAVSYAKTKTGFAQTADAIPLSLEG